VLCGRGNNGGGGMVAARHLHNRGALVSATLVGDPAGMEETPAHQWDILQAMALTQADEPDLRQADLIVDAIIGYGLTGDPRGPAARWIERVNAAGRPVLALDVPSGLNATTGVPGRPCIRATATLTLALPKTGLATAAGRAVSGRLFLADLGVPLALYRRLGLDVEPLFIEDTIISLERTHDQPQ
jgi:NAD(P)H-hydrate epimerase